MKDLENNKIIVTGASGGIGNSIVEKLIENGANILASGTRVEKLEELKNKLKNIKILKFDISQNDKIEEFIENASNLLGGLDCVINNAGITQDNLAIRMNLEEWKKVSKAGVVAMSKSLAIEYAKKNINVNCISPGFIKTAMTDKIDEKFKEVIISKIPSARLGEPQDIANAVNFLASNQSDYINGETLHVNGGMYMA